MEKQTKFVKATLSIGCPREYVDAIKVPINASEEVIEQMVWSHMLKYVEVWFEDFEDEEELEQYM